jgi:hypothetical protein
MASTSSFDNASPLPEMVSNIALINGDIVEGTT